MRLNFTEEQKHIGGALITSYSLFFLAIIFLNPDILNLITLDVKFFVMLIPFISIYLTNIFLDKNYIYGIFTKDSITVFTLFLTMITIILTLFNPISGEGGVKVISDNRFTELNIVANSSVYYSLIYLFISSTISLLSHDKRIRAIFGLSNILLITTILFTIFRMKYGIVMTSSWLLSKIFCAFSNCFWNYFLLIIGTIVITILIQLLFILPWMGKKL